jgi:hypothetical protein
MKTIDYNKKFVEQLQQGNKGEVIVAKWLEKYKGLKTLEFNNTIDYDIKMTDYFFEETYEVKCDRWEYWKKIKTGNMFFETRSGNKPSGIWATKADFYCYYYPDFGELWFIETNKLKELCKTRPDVCIRKADAGDNSKIKGFTINRYKWKELFEHYNINIEIWDKIKIK